MAHRRIQSFLSAALLSFAVSVAGQVAPISALQAKAPGWANSAPPKVPSLDVISVKPNKIGAGMSMGDFDGGVIGTNVSVHQMLTQGYHLNDNQLINEPDWAKSERFDVKGKVADADAEAARKLSWDQKRVFFQQVLKERFGLVAHRETRELPEYALTPAKGGVKLVDGKADPNVSPDMRSGGFRTNMRGGVKKIDCAGMPIDLLVQFLSNETGRTVVNKVGLDGKYSYTLSWRPAMAQAATDDAGDSTPDLFTAVQEQLGLKLEPVKGPVDVLVIDHLERPAAN